VERRKERGKTGIGRAWLLQLQETKGDKWGLDVFDDMMFWIQDCR
jgi:hypothetical protein